MQDLNVLALFKGSDRFVFVYDDESRAELLDAVRNCAADSDSSLNWYDAAVLTDRARKQFDQADAAASMADLNDSYTADEPL